MAAWENIPWGLSHHLIWISFDIRSTHTFASSSSTCRIHQGIPTTAMIIIMEFSVRSRSHFWLIHPSTIKTSVGLTRDDHYRQGVFHSVSILNICDDQIWVQIHVLTLVWICVGFCHMVKRYPSHLSVPFWFSVWLLLWHHTMDRFKCCSGNFNKLMVSNQISINVGFIRLQSSY